MRTIAATAFFFVTAIAVWAQQPPQGQPQPAPALPPEGPQRDQWLDAILKNWEHTMMQVRSLEATQCERVNEDPTFKTRDVYSGTVRFLKGEGKDPSSRASLDLVHKDNPKVRDRVVLTGSFLYQFEPSAKEIRVHALPQPKGNENNDQSLVALLFGMKSEQAKQRFKIDLVHADSNYYYLQILPKSEQDKADFSKAQLALLRTTYMPRQLHFFQVNGAKVSWDLPRIQTPAPNLSARDFQPPELPSGWKWNRVQASGPGPSKVRSSGAN